MLRFITQRVLHIVLVSIAIVFFVFWGMRLVERSDQFQSGITVAEAAQSAIEDSQTFFSDAVRGDLGEYRLRTGALPVSEMPVTELIRQSFGASMGLLLLAGLLAAIVGILLGIFVALRSNKFLAFVVLGLTVIGISIPSFFAAMMLQQSVIFYLREYGKRLLSVGGFGWNYEHMVLPILVLSARPIAYLMRTSYTVLNSAMDEDYVRTAFGKGLSRRAVINRHALKNVAVPVLTAIGVSWRFSLGVLPVVEYMFAWPGMGLRVLNAISTRQATVVVALSLAFGLTLMVGNLAIDLLYRLIDPRVRENYG